MHSSRHPRRVLALFAKLITVLALGLCTSIQAQDKAAPTIDVTQKLAGFDAFMEKMMKDWNAPGIGGATH